MDITNLTLQIEKLSPKNGDVIVLKYPADTQGNRIDFRHSLEDLSQRLQAPNRPDLVVMLVEDLWEIRNIDEEEMKRFGWIKITRI